MLPYPSSKVIQSKCTPFSMARSYSSRAICHLGRYVIVVGNAGLATTGPILRPALRQIQLAVDQAVEAVTGIAQVDRDDAVLLLAQRAAPLALDTGRLVPLLDVAGLVDDADGMRPGMFVADDVLELVAQEVVVPVVLAEELLECARCDAGVEGDRLDALLGDVRDLAGDVGGQVGAGVLAWEAVVEPLEELPELGLERSDLGDVHARVSINLGDKHSFAMAGESRWYDLAL